MGKKRDSEEFEPQKSEEWERLDPAIVRLIEKAADRVDSADSKAHAEVLATKLNKKLDLEGYIGSTVRLRSPLPIVMEEIITNDGVEKRSVVDPDVLGQEYYEGSFSGCSLIEFEDIKEQFLTYDVTAATSRGFLLVRSVIDMTHLEIRRDLVEEEDESDVMIAGAFNVLESVPDEDYIDAVDALRSAFENFDQPAIIRAKQIGFFAAVLLASPEHIKHTARMTALDVILKYSYDDELEYIVGGYREYDNLDEEFNSNLRVTGPESPERAIITGVKYLTDFEITYLNEDGLTVKENDGLQPAFVIKLTSTGAEYDYPLRFLSRFEEYQFHRIDELEDVDYAASHAGLKPTCGEQTRDFWEKVQTGQIAMGKATLRRLNLED